MFIVEGNEVWDVGSRSIFGCPFKDPGGVRKRSGFKRHEHLRNMLRSLAEERGSQVYRQDLIKAS